MYLSDNTSNPLKWQFPAGTTIVAGGYLLIWADDDGDSPGLHTNFKLSAGGVPPDVARGGTPSRPGRPATVCK